MTTSTISCTIDTTNPTAALGMEIWLDDQQVFNSEHISESTPVTFAVSDDDGEHELRFVLKNKLAEHTQIDDTGAIVADAMLTVNNMTFEDIELGALLTECTVYQHDVNGTGRLEEHKFYGSLGCNGTATLKITTPIYLWLLESM